MDVNFIRTVLNKAMELSQFANLRLASLEAVKSDGYFYKASQRETLGYARKLIKDHAITVIISREKTNESAGQARGGRQQHNVLFTMRSLYNENENHVSAKAIDNNARIFLHELGHETGLWYRKQNEKRHLDNYYKTDDGRAFAKKYLR